MLTPKILNLQKELGVEKKSLKPEIDEMTKNKHGTHVLHSWFHKESRGSDFQKFFENI